MDQPEVVTAANAFAARWVERVRGGENTALAPAGVWPLLALLCAGATGAARDELERAVGCPAEEAPGRGLALLDDLDGRRGVRLAAGLWLRDDVELTDAWRRDAPPELQRALTGTPTTDQAAIDRWVHERTGGQLERLPFALSEDTMLLLASALAIDVRWVAPFEDLPMRVRDGPWADLAPAGLLRTTEDFDELSIVDAPCGRLTMLSVESEDDVVVHVVLGPEEVTAGEVLAACVRGLAGEHERTRGSAIPTGAEAPGVTWGLHRFEPTPIVVANIPRFSFTHRRDLLVDADALGLASATDLTHGHFPGISAFPLGIGQARQDLVVAFTAEGFRAAAMTAFDLLAGGVPPEVPRSILFSIRRPFGFVATTRAGLVLLAGWVDLPDAYDWDAAGYERPEDGIGWQRRSDA